MKKLFCIGCLLLILSEVAFSQSDTSFFATDSLPPVMIADTNQIPATSENSSDTTFSDQALADTASSAPVILDDTVLVSFVNYKTIIEAGKVYFNVLVIKNLFDYPVTGDIQLWYPKEWRNFSKPPKNVTIEPDDSVLIPLRFTMPPEMYGGITYILNAIYKTAQEEYSGNAYLQIKEVNNWTAEVSDRIVYFNKYYSTSSFDIKISNRGNAKELYKIQYVVGKLYHLDYKSDEKIVEYLELPPGKDTIIHHTVTRANLSEKEYRLYKNMWSQQTIRIQVSSKEKTKRFSIWVKDLESYYTLANRLSASPLNFSIQFYNLLSQISPRLAGNVWGTVLLKKDRAVSYWVRPRNFFIIATDRNKDYFSRPQNYTAGITYTSPKWTVRLGNIYSSPWFWTANSIGVQASHKISNRTEITGNISRHRFFPVYNYALYFKDYRAGFDYTVGGGYIDREAQFDNSSIFGYVNVRRTIFQHHTIGVGVIGSSTKFDNLVIPTTGDVLNNTRFNLSYLGNYVADYDRLRINLSGRIFNNAEAFYPSTMLINGNVNYTLSEKLSLRGFYYRLGNITGSYPEVLINPQNENIQEIIRPTLRYSVSRNSSYMLGPSTRYFLTRRYDSRNDTILRTYSRYIGLYQMFNYRLNTFQSLTPYLNVGYTYVNDTLSRLYAYSPYLTFAAGATFRDQWFYVTALYRYGVFTGADQYYLLKGGSVDVQTFQLRPSVQKYLYHNRVRLSGYANYLISMPSYRSSFNLAPQIDIYMNRGWAFTFMLNYFANTRTDRETGGLLKSGAVNAFASISKSFNIQQPRLKYYDLKVVCFKDVDGNGQLDENEARLANIIVRVEKENKQDYRIVKDGFIEKELITNPDGEAGYLKIPEGNYKLTFIPMFGLEDLYNVNGVEQSVAVTGDQTLYVPYAEAYVIKGVVRVEKSQFSKSGRVKLGGIRITARNKAGNEYTALTDNSGYFILHIPGAGHYEVTAKNVFGEDYELEREKFIVDFNGFKSFDVEFVFKEKERKINFGGEGEYQFKFNKDKAKASGGEEEKPEDHQQGTGNGLTEEQMNELKQLIQDIINIEIKNQGRQGLTEEEIRMIDKMIRDIHFGDENDKGSQNAAPQNYQNRSLPIDKIEIDEMSFTKVLQGYEEKLHQLDKQISELEQTMNNPNSTADERQAAQAQIKSLQQQKQLIQNKFNNAEKNLREIRNTLDEQQAEMPHVKTNKSPVFELNRPNAYSATNPIPKTEDLPDGLIYKVQVGVFSEEKPPAYFKGLYPLTEHVISEGLYEYDAGIFYSYEQALEAKKQIQQKGFKDAFIVAFHNKKPISISQALRIERQQ